MKKPARLLVSLLVAVSLCCAIGAPASAGGLTLITAAPEAEGNHYLINYTILSSEIGSGSNYDVALWCNTVSGLTGASCIYSAEGKGLSGSLTFETANLSNGLYYVYVVVTYNGYSSTSNPVMITLADVGVLFPEITADSETRITKSPSGETVAPGEDAYFIAAAENYSKVEWRVVSSDATECFKGKDEIETRFPGVSFNAWTSDDNREYLHLVYIPAIMDGYLIQAKFWSTDGNESYYTDLTDAVLTVTEPEPEPTPTATPVPTTEVTPTPDAGSTEPISKPDSTVAPVRVSQDPAVARQRQNASVAIGIAALGLVTIACGIYLLLRKNKDRE